MLGVGANRRRPDDVVLLGFRIATIDLFEGGDDEEGAAVHDLKG